MSPCEQILENPMLNKELGRKEGVSRDEDQAREGEGFGIKDLLGLSLEDVRRNYGGSFVPPR